MANQTMKKGSLPTPCRKLHWFKAQLKPTQYKYFRNFTCLPFPQQWWWQASSWTPHPKTIPICSTSLWTPKSPLSLCPSHLPNKQSITNNNSNYPSENFEQKIEKKWSNCTPFEVDSLKSIWISLLELGSRSMSIVSAGKPLKNQQTRRRKKRIGFILYIPRWVQSIIHSKNPSSPT